MGRIIRFNPDRHEETRTLLPWFLSGQLEAEERARVEAHLRDCAECQSELRLERRLARAVADLPVDVDQGWTELRRRLEAAPARRDPLGRLGQALAAPGRAGWAVAAQFVLVVVIVGALALPFANQPRYHALGAPPPAPLGDVIVVFQPEAKVEDLARVLRANGARLVDGPTTADAYVLNVPLGQRTAVLGRLRADSAIAMAEPIDAPEQP
jgi:anti-sigma factor RsiW